MARLTDLPTEILLEIIEYLEFLSDVNAVVRTNRLLMSQSNNRLYDRIRADINHEMETSVLMKPRSFTGRQKMGNMPVYGTLLQAGGQAFMALVLAEGSPLPERYDGSEIVHTRRLKDFLSSETDKLGR